MRIGVPKEIKNNESRVAMTPAGVVTLSKAGMKFLLKRMRALHRGSVTKNMPKPVPGS